MVDLVESTNGMPHKLGIDLSHAWVVQALGSIALISFEEYLIFFIDEHDQWLFYESFCVTGNS